MKVTYHSGNVLTCTSGAWRVCSLSDGYIDMPAELLRDADNRPVAGAAPAGAPLRLAVNCFALGGPGGGGVLIDSGAGGSLDPTMGHLEQALREAGIAPASISVFAITHTHPDHVNGLLTPSGQALLPNLRSIVIAEAAVESFLAEEPLAPFRPLLTPVRPGDRVAEGLTAVALPGHAPGHSGYALDTGEDRLLFVGDIVHVPALQFDHPEFTWGYDDDQPMAHATRVAIFHDAAEAGTWVAGAHLGRPGIGRVVRTPGAYRYEPIA